MCVHLYIFYSRNFRRQTTGFGIPSKRLARRFIDVDQSRARTQRILSYVCNVIIILLYYYCEYVGSTVCGTNHIIIIIITTTARIDIENVLIFYF